MTDARKRIAQWVLVGGNRHVVATLLLASTFLVLVLLGHLGIIGVEDQDTVRGVIGGFVPG